MAEQQYDSLSPQDQVAILTRETTSSIELTRNAKGDYQWSIKAYFDGSNCLDQNRALAQVQDIDSHLRDAFFPQVTDPLPFRRSDRPG